MLELSLADQYKFSHTKQTRKTDYCVGVLRRHGFNHRFELSLRRERESSIQTAGEITRC